MIYSKVTDGRQLKAGRIILGLTVDEMAEAAKLNRNSVLRVERFQNLPYYAHAADKIAKALEERGISFDWEFTVERGSRLAVCFPGKTLRKLPKYARKR